MMNKGLNYRIRNLFPTPQPLAWRSTTLKYRTNETHKTGVYQTLREFRKSMATRGASTR